MGRARTFLSLLILSGAAAPPAGAADDSDVYALIDALRPVAEAIVVDGDASDWGAIPEFTDPFGDAGGDATRDVASVRIAPTDDALAVLVETAGAPSTGGYAFWIRFDFMGLQFADVELALDATGADGLSWFEEGGCSAPPPDDCSMEWDASELALGAQYVEIRVPYAALNAALPASMQGRLSGGAARSWVRVWVHTIDYLPGWTEVDHGAAVGSFRLVATPYALDPPLPPGGEPFTAFASPLAGPWYVGQGAMTNGTHAGVWAYDLHRTDESFHPENPVGSSDLADHYAFALPIRAPAAGTVYSLVDSHPDHPAYDYSPPPPANFLFLEVAGGLGLLFSHTKQGSIQAVQGEALGAGDYVGQVGHSGAVGWPHLHYAAEEIDNGFASHPLGILDAEVGLNPTPSDPWKRDIPSWGIREGFFLLPEPGRVGGLAACLAGLAALAARGRRRACAWSLVALAVLGFASGAHADAADEAALAEQLGTARYHEGFPPEYGNRISDAGAARLAELLADPEQVRHHATLIEALAASGRAVAFDALAAYAAQDPGAAVDAQRWRARRTLPVAMGMLARHDERALVWLVARASARGPAAFRAGPLDAARVGERLHRQLLYGLALSGRAEARAALQAAPGDAAARERALALHAATVRELAP